MTLEQQIRLEALKLAIPPGIANPDMDLVMDRARRYERYVAGEGQAKPAPSPQPAPPAHKPGHSGQTRHR
jgi:hypothetical protein